MAQVGKGVTLAGGKKMSALDLQVPSPHTSYVSITRSSLVSSLHVSLFDYLLSFILIYKFVSCHYKVHWLQKDRGVAALVNLSLVQVSPV